MRWGWLAAVASAAVVAHGAALALSPRPDQLIRPAAVKPAEEFGAAQLERGRGFRTPQAAIGVAALCVQLALLAYLVARPPARLAAVGRPLLGGAIAGAALSLALTAAVIPLEAVGRQRAREVGLATQSWPAWGKDQLMSGAIAAIFAAVSAVVVLALMRRLPRMWWLPGSGFVVIAAAAITFAGPVVLDPLFNRFERVSRGELGSDILALARDADVRVSDVYIMDASRRTTAVNAYVAGLGATKRVVLYDNLVRRLPPAEVRSIVAHELGHERYDDLRRGLLYVAIVAPFGLLAVAAMAGRMAGARRGTPAALPALALAFVVISTGITWISNGLSRKVEARADAFALRATRDPRAFIDMQRRLVISNVSDPSPPAVVRSLLMTHPTPVERIGMARAAGASWSYRLSE